MIPFSHFVTRCWNYIRDNRFTFYFTGVHLLGIDSVNVGMDKRKIVWQRLATDLDITEKAVYQEITLEELPLFLKHYKQGSTY